MRRQTDRQQTDGQTRRFTVHMGVTVRKDAGLQPIDLSLFLCHLPTEPPAPDVDVEGMCRACEESGPGTDNTRGSVLSAMSLVTQPGSSATVSHPRLLHPVFNSLINVRRVFPGHYSDSRGKGNQSVFPRNNLMEEFLPNICW